jgi:DNA (cytosine-5)-methyltransferase 1
MSSAFFLFADLCSGIGGFHQAASSLGGKCVQACDIDSTAREIYELNYGIIPHDDVNTLKPTSHKLDLVCFGNPCQSFSTIGKRRGLKDKRGQVFYAICKYLKETDAKCFIMENVKGLTHLNKGREFQKMLRVLTSLGYNVSYNILNSVHFNTPQSRERVFVIGHKTKTFEFTNLLTSNSKIKPLFHYLDKSKPDRELVSRRFDHFDLSQPPKVTKSGFIVKAEIAPYTEKRLFSSHGTIGTIMSSVSPFIYDERHQVTRNLSVSELLRCQSFPTTFKFPPNTSRNKALKYIGNAVAPNVIKALLQEMKKQKLI